MKALTTAIIHLATFIELSGDDVIDPDSAVSALEQLGADLKEASVGEIEFLKAAIRDEIGKMPENRTPADQMRGNFLLDFLETLGEAQD
ncbi:MAG TPA: hypothetical protein DCP71_01535 [Verrucomicrobiales bacterium]|jgi:hypothetical protein|nr:hypothetical protein [Verrucomicrobiales bacterium]